MRVFKKSVDREQVWCFCGMLAALLAGTALCLAAGLEPRTLQEENPGEYRSVFLVTRADLETEPEAETITDVDLSDCAGQCRITEGGSYRLYGVLNGTVLVDAQEQVVHLLFDGVYVRAVNGPAVLASGGGKVVVTLCEGTNNELYDSASYLDAQEENACLFSAGDLTVNGSGSLQVSGYYKDGIHAKDEVKILGGNLTVQAKRDGIRGNDGILIDAQRLQIESEGSGLHTTKNKKKTGGNIEICRGDLWIHSGEYAVESRGDFAVTGGSLNAKGAATALEIDGAQYLSEGCLTIE